jgi:protein involved in polysaccharide export with SLBB domain
MGRINFNTVHRAFRRSSKWSALVWVCLGVWILFACGCSSSAAKTSNNDELPRQGRSRALLTPEECEANAAKVNAEINDSSTRLIEPGDQLEIEFYLSPEFNDKVTVGPDGNIALPVAGVVRAAGLTPAHLAALLDQAYMRELRNPNVSVHILGTPGRQIYVGGEVAHPGAFPLLPGMTALQAIHTAGGFVEFANLQKVVLIRRDACGIPHNEILNLKAEANPEKSEDIALAPHDLLFVTPRKVKNVDMWVKHYMTNMLPLPVYPYMNIP